MDSFEDISYTTSTKIILGSLGIIVLIVLILLLKSNNPIIEYDSEYDNVNDDSNSNSNDYMESMLNLNLNHIDDFNDNYQWMAYNNLLPMWNSSRRTRNMSYDLRGDIPIYPFYTGPFYNSPYI